MLAVCDIRTHLTSAKLAGRSTISAPPKSGVLREVVMFWNGGVCYTQCYGGRWDVRCCNGNLVFGYRLQGDGGSTCCGLKSA